jgi:uncharacterized protein YxjI
MGLRDRRERKREERQQFGARGDAPRYQMRQKILAFGDDFWIEDDRGQRVFRINGKALRLRQTMDFEDATGAHLCRIQTRVMHLRDTMEIERSDGARLAMVHKALITPLRERWKVDIPDSAGWEMHGNIVDHEYEIEEDGRKIAEVSKKWFRLRDTYGVQVGQGADTVLVLAVSAALDAMAHPSR